MLLAGIAAIIDQIKLSSKRTSPFSFFSFLKRKQQNIVIEIKPLLQRGSNDIENQVGFCPNEELYIYFTYINDITFF